MNSERWKTTLGGRNRVLGSEWRRSWKAGVAGAERGRGDSGQAGQRLELDPKGFGETGRVY